MRLHRLITGLAVVALVALPLGAGIRAMTLDEHVEISTDTVHATIVAKETFSHPYDGDEAFWTKLTIQGVSMRSDEVVEMDLVFLGSHDPADHFGTSEMPTVQDTRVGNETVLFVFDEKNTEMGRVNMVHNLGDVYRVENVFGQPVVIGKGEGAAFAENTALSEATLRVKEAHARLQAEKKAQGK